jgi:hypothetical protein
VGYNGRGFFPLWDTTEEFFSVEGYNRRGFFPLWDTTEKVFLRCGIQWKRFFPLWDTMEKNLRMANNFFPMYPTPQQNLMRCTVSHNTTQKNCGIQHRKIFRTVSHNAAGFLPLYPTMEDTTQNYILKF